jgi:hypothetical protein
MQPIYKVLLVDADHGAVSPVVQFTQGVGTIFAYGDMPHGHDAVVFEVSHDGINFMPLDGVPEVTEPVSFTFTLAHGCYVRARVPEHGGSGCSVSVVLC